MLLSGVGSSQAAKKLGVKGALGEDVGEDGAEE
jgi:hypothetical protein